MLSIQKAVAGEAQSGLVDIFSPYIEPRLEELFGDKLNYKIRVSAQVKSLWNSDIIKKKRKGFFVDDIFYEDKNKPSICFPTRAHQDLDNNGNRSTHTTIFYFQLTPNLPTSSIMEFGQFSEKVGILPFSSEWGYRNEILHKVQNEIDWISPDLNPGNIVTMNALTPHRSTFISEFPRIALNVKIQPSNLCYLENIYGYSLQEMSKLSSFKNKIIYLKDILIDLSKKQRLVLFELAVLYFLLGDKINAINSFKKLFLYPVDDDLLEKWLIASISRKHITNVKLEDLSETLNPIESVVKLSCGDAILETIKLYS